MPISIKPSGLAKLEDLKAIVEGRQPPPSVETPAEEEEFELFAGSYQTEGLDGWKEPIMLIPGYKFRVSFREFSGLYGAMRFLENMMNEEGFAPTYNSTVYEAEHPMSRQIEMIEIKSGRVLLTGYLEYVYDYVRFQVKKLKIPVPWL